MAADKGPFPVVEEKAILEPNEGLELTEAANVGCLQWSVNTGGFRNSAQAFGIAGVVWLD